MAVKNLPSTFLLLSLCCPYAFSNVTRLRPVSLAPSENMNSAANTSIPQTVSFDSITVTAQASLVQNLTLVNVLIKNGSPRTLAVSPHLFSAADGNLLMLKLMEPASVTSILQADLAAIQAQYANSMAYQQPSGPDPFTQTLSSYMFGQMGLKGDTRDLAANLTASVIQNMNRDPQMAFLPPPDITPSMVARESLEISELESGYSAEGIIFFTVPKKLPLTLKVRINGKQLSMAFDASMPPPGFELASSERQNGNGNLPAEETSVDSTAKADISYGMALSDVMTAVAAKNGRCNQPEKESRNSPIEYVDCELGTPMILTSSNQTIIDAVKGTTNKKCSLSAGGWTWIFRDGRLVNHKATIRKYR